MTYTRGLCMASMRTDTLDGIAHILRKVEAGEPLRDEELGRLEKAAAASAELQPRLAIAHALLNDDRAREGLSRVEELRRQFPASIDVRLARARALALLERYGSAEEELKAVLGQRPDDPEALKAWALLRMRHGELEPARAIAKDLLERDPFDEEAQLIHGEMSATTGASAELVEDRRSAFRAALFARLGQLGVRFRPQAGGVLVQTGGGKTLRVGFDAQEHLEAPTFRARAVQLAEGLASMAQGMPQTAERLFAEVLPVLVSATGAEGRPGALQREGPAGLMELLVVEHPELMLFVPTGLVTALNAEPQALFETARARLEQRVSRPERVPSVQSRIFTWMEGDGADTARISSPAHRPLLLEVVGEGPWHVGLLDAEHVFVCRAADHEARADLKALVRQAGDGAVLLALSADGALSPLALHPSA